MIKYNSSEYAIKVLSKNKLDANRL